MFNNDITVLKDDECNEMRVIVPMSKVKMMYNENFPNQPRDSMFGNSTDEDYMLEIACEIKRINKIPMHAKPM